MLLFGQQKSCSKINQQVHSLCNVGNASIAARRQTFPKGRLIRTTSPVKIKKGYSVDVTLNTHLQLMHRSNNKTKVDNASSTEEPKEDPVSRLIRAAAEKRQLKTRAAKLWTLAKTMVCDYAPAYIINQELHSS